MVDLPLKLTMEQAFALRTYADQLAEVPPDIAKDFLIELMRQIMIKDNVIRHLMKQQLGIN